MAQPASAPAPTTKTIIERRSFPPGHAPITDLPFIAPLYESEYQRQGDGVWVLVRKGMGFA